MKILFIHEVNYLKKPIFEMHELPEYLAAKGHQIYFLHFPEGASRADLAKLPWSSEIAGRVIRSANLTLLTPKVLSTGLLGRLFVALRGHSIVREAIRTAKPELVVTLAVPTYGWQAVRVTKKVGVPIVYRALDVAHLIRGGMFRSLVERAETFVAKRADFVSANNAAMAQYVRVLGARRDEVEVHFPPMNLGMYREGERERGRKKIGVIASDRIILYMGSFFYFSGLPEVIREFSRLSPDAQTKLVLVGGGELSDELVTLVKRLGLENQVLLTGFVGFESLPDYLAAADVLINPMRKSLVSDTALPNKIIQYLAASRSIVSTNLKGVDLTFRGYSELHLVGSPEQCIRRALEINVENGQVQFNMNHLLLENDFGPSSIMKFENFFEHVVVSQ